MPKEKDLYGIDNPNYDPNALPGQAGSLSPDAITAASLAPTVPFKPTQPDVTPIAPVAGLNAEVTPLAPLPQETAQSDLIKQLQGLTMETTGEAGFRAEQESIQGIPELTKTQNDLSARLKTLQNEALAIPLQLQQEATGRGITAGGLRPIETAALRNNAIQALSVSSLLEASRGNLTTAQSLADRAVAQKYDPIKAEINAKLTNLELLSKDPTLTLAQKNRLDAQKAVQDAKLAEAAQAEALYKEVQKIAVDAAGNAQNFTPTSQFRTLAQALEAIQSSDPQTALQIAASVGLTGADPLDRQLKLLQIQQAQKSLAGGSPDAPTVKTINGVDMQWNATTQKWEPVSTTSGANTDASRKTLDQLAFLKTTATEAKKLSGAAGPSTLTRIIGDTFKGDTKFRQLEQQSNTLRVNVLALMTDPTIKKFFGPQMSNADVALMTSAGTTLNPQANNPTQMKSEIERLENLFTRMQVAVQAGQALSTSAPEAGETHVYNGVTYVVKDGQWVPQ